MCGVFGFVANRFGTPNMRALKWLAEYNEKRRGGHAWGISWVDLQGRIRMHKQAGRLDAGLMMALAVDSVALIGHLRYTTQGTEKVNANNHPHPCDGGWMVHNGVLADYGKIKDNFSTAPLSDCDSEMLAIAWADAPKSRTVDRASWMVETCQPIHYSPLVVLGLWQKQLVAVRQGNPLHLYHTDEGCYLSSLDVPGADLGAAELVSDDTVLTWTKKKLGWERTDAMLDTQPINLPPAKSSKFLLF